MLSTDDLKEKVIYYVKERKCNGGGFCFYRLEEPNGSDTYYAVSILNLLNIKFRDINTMNYLRDLQKEDGSYSSVFSAYYSIKTLNILKEKPIQDPKPYILENIRIYNTNRIPPGYTSIFREMYYLIDLCFTLKVELEEKIKNNLINFILKFKKGEGGFGYTHSTLIETSQALSILKWLEYPIKMLNAENFLKKCYAASDVFVTSSILEGFGLSVIEALAAGKPVICSGGGALREIVKDGVNGILVGKANPEAFAQAMLNLAHDEKARKIMGKAGRELVKNNFSWRKTAEATIHVYESILSGEK